MSMDTNNNDNEKSLLQNKVVVRRHVPTLVSTGVGTFKWIMTVFSNSSAWQSQLLWIKDQDGDDQLSLHYNEFKDLERFGVKWVGILPLLSWIFTLNLRFMKRVSFGSIHDQ